MLPPSDQHDGICFSNFPKTRPFIYLYIFKCHPSSLQTCLHKTPQYRFPVRFPIVVTSIEPRPEWFVFDTVLFSRNFRGGIWTELARESLQRQLAREIYIGIYSSANMKYNLELLYIPDRTMFSEETVTLHCQLDQTGCKAITVWF